MMKNSTLRSIKCVIKKNMSDWFISTLHEQISKHMTIISNIDFVLHFLTIFSELKLF